MTGSAGVERMPTVYANPRYYEIAFSFRDFVEEIDLFEKIIAQYSRIPVSRMLEVACGHAPHLEEIDRRGYEYVGLDCSEEMIANATAKAREAGITATFRQGSLVDFTLSRQAEFAFILLGSLYVESTQDLLSHFRVMEKALKSGGLYFLDWCVSFSPLQDHQDAWEMEANGIRVKTTYRARTIDAVEQKVEESITLKVDDHGDHKTLEERTVRRVIFPQEFLVFVAERTEFEFVGWWNNWNLDSPLSGEQEITRPIVVLRRR